MWMMPGGDTGPPLAALPALYSAVLFRSTWGAKRRTDATVAARGIYLLSFLPQAEVDRIVDESVAGGKRSFAALIPESAYGNAVEAQFREAVARKGARLAGIERYPPGQPGPAVERLAAVITGPAAQADALFLPETPDGLPAVSAALMKAGFSPARVRPNRSAMSAPTARSSAPLPSTSPTLATWRPKRSPAVTPPSAETRAVSVSAT